MPVKYSLPPFLVRRPVVLFPTPSIFPYVVPDPLTCSFTVGEAVPIPTLPANMTVPPKQVLPVEQIVPEIVYTSDKGVKSVSYDSIIGLLIEAIKEQQMQLTDQQNKIDSLMNYIKNK